MKYTEDVLQSLGDPVEYVRANPDRFIAGGVPNLAAIAGDIALDALVLGATDVRTVRFGEWWIVCSNIDWLSVPCRCPAAPRDAFNRVLAFPELADNSCRHEILATAYAESVVSASGGDRFVVSGDVAVEDPIWAQLDGASVKRSVALRGSLT